MYLSHDLSKVIKLNTKALSIVTTFFFYSDTDSGIAPSISKGICAKVWLYMMIVIDELIVSFKLPVWTSILYN